MCKNMRRLSVRVGRVLSPKVTRKINTAVLVILAMAFILSGCGKSAPTPTPVPTPTPRQVYFELGQWAETSFQLATVTSVNQLYSYVYYIGTRSQRKVTAPPGTVYIRVMATVVNMGDDPMLVFAEDLVITDSEGHRYQYAGHEGEVTFSSQDLDPGRTMNGQITFVVPEIATGLEVSWFLSGEPPIRATWKLE
jgi:hypothetical protein